MSIWSASGVPVIAEIDTRAVVRHLRANGVMRGVIFDGEPDDVDALVAKARAHPEDGWHGSRERGDDEEGVRVERGRAEESDRRFAAAGCRCGGDASRCMWWRMTSGSSRTFCAC